LAIVLFVLFLLVIVLFVLFHLVIALFVLFLLVIVLFVLLFKALHYPFGIDKPFSEMTKDIFRLSVRIPYFFLHDLIQDICLSSGRVLIVVREVLTHLKHFVPAFS
jgi:hypothetical protein